MLGTAEPRKGHAEKQRSEYRGPGTNVVQHGPPFQIVVHS